MKHKKTILFVVWLLGLAAAGGAAVKDDFSAANSYYQAGHYDEALRLYLQINHQVTNWKVLYNIGSCYFKLDQPLAAKIHYLRARKFQPLDPSIARSIAMVNKRFKDAIVPETPDFISGAIEVLQAKLSLNALSLLLLAAVLLLNIFLFLLLRRGRQKKIIYGLAFSLILCLALGAVHYRRGWEQRQISTAVVSAENTVLRSGPGEGNTELFKVNPGLEVKILDRSRNWVQVAASPQVAGWIELKHLTLI